MAPELKRNLERSEARRGITPRRAARAQRPTAGRRSLATRRSERGEARAVGARHVQRVCVDKLRRPPHPRQADATARLDCLHRDSPLINGLVLPNGPGPRVSTRPAMRRCVAPATILALVSEAEGRGPEMSRRTHDLRSWSASGELGHGKQGAGRVPCMLPGRSAGLHRPPRERCLVSDCALRRRENDERKVWREWRRK